MAFLKRNFRNNRNIYANVSKSNFYLSDDPRFITKPSRWFTQKRQRAFEAIVSQEIKLNKRSDVPRFSEDFWGNDGKKEIFLI